VQLEDWASKNLKDRYFSLIDRLVEEEIADECTVPFVPYVGANYCDAKPKILIIGKATYGWGKGDGGQQGSGTLHDVLDKDDHDRWKYLVELPEEFIEGEIIPYYGERKVDPQGPSGEGFISLRANFCWIVRSRMSGISRCRRSASSP
jgi:hypothetical protein